MLDSSRRPLVLLALLIVPTVACTYWDRRTPVDTLNTVPVGPYSGEIDTSPQGALDRVPIGTSPTRGPDDAWVTMVEFSDFECPFCVEVEPVLAALLQEYSSDLRLVFKNYPLTDIHPYSQGAAIAAECAGAQGAFWEMHDLLFANQDALDGADLPTLAQSARLDVNAWQQCLSTQPPLDAVDADVALGNALRVRGTPTFVINGQRVLGALTQAQFELIINAARDKATASGVARSQYYNTVILGS